MANTRKVAGKEQKGQEVDKKQDIKEEDLQKEQEQRELESINNEIKRHKFIDNYEKLQQELKQGFRVVEYEGKEYYIHLPSVKDEEEIMLFRSKLAGAMLQDKNILTREQLLKQIKERGIWSDEKERQEQKLNEYITELLARIFAEYAKDNPDPNKILAWKREKDKLEQERAILALPKTTVLSYSFESLLELAINKIKLSLCVKDKDGNRIWPSVETLEQETDKGLVQFLTIEAQYFWFGWHPDLL
jgi:hypothetical protein